MGWLICLAVILLIALLIRPLVLFIGLLLQMGISRQREYAADAVAVRLCSYNEGLARALEKLGGDDYSKEEVQSLGGRELACMYINFPGEELFSTHPSNECQAKQNTFLLSHQFHQKIKLHLMYH